MAIKISDLLPPVVTVPINGKDVPIKPLNLEQIIRLLTIYRYDLVVMFSDTVSGDLNLITLVATAPRMVADILAYGLDADGQQDDIVKLPAYSQVELLAAVWKASVPDPKKLMSLLLGAVEGLQAAGINPVLSGSETTQANTESETTAITAPLETVILAPLPVALSPLEASESPLVPSDTPQEQGSTTT